MCRTEMGSVFTWLRGANHVAAVFPSTGCIRGAATLCIKHSLSVVAIPPLHREHVTWKRRRLLSRFLGLLRARREKRPRD